eukprot:Skav228694  [mRNA]  locus=scaffold2247:482125:485083:- [translate_table: standard]
MGCWELAAAGNQGSQSGLFTAVVPVAAYHKEPLRWQIAEALKKTPIFAVHSRKDCSETTMKFLGVLDTTCPLAKEKHLYEELQGQGSTLRVDLCDYVRTSMHRVHVEFPNIYDAWRARLTDLGRRQAASAWQRSASPSVVLTSPLMRCVETALLAFPRARVVALEEMGGPMAKTAPVELRELISGSAHNSQPTRAELTRNFPEALRDVMGTWSVMGTYRD